jgi:hypothetical protein
MVTATAKNRIASNGHAKKKEETQEVAIRPIDIAEFEIPIQGTTPLIVHKFSEKARKSITDKQQQKAKGGREKRDPESEYYAAMYIMPGTGKPQDKKAKHGVPAAGFKKAACSACRYIDGINMTFAKGAFHVIDDAGGYVQINFKELRMREDTIRLPNKALDLRYRPEYIGWSCVLRIQYNRSAISAEQIVNMFHHAGFHIGWGELRPEKGFSNGMWTIRTQ